MRVKVQRWLRNHPATCLIIVVLVGVLISSAFQGDSLVFITMQSLVLALFLVGALFLLDRDYFGLARQIKITKGKGICLSLLAIALVAAIVSYAHFLSETKSIGDAWITYIAAFVVMCLCTGVFEEFLFRGILFYTVNEGFKEKKHSFIKAAVVTSVLFGLFHISSSSSTTEVIDTVMLVQAFLKPVQAALFGFIMTALFVCTKSLWPLALLHALNNLIMQLPQVLFTGSITTTYLSGSAYDLFGLCITTLLYVPLLVVSVKILREAE